MCGVFGIITKNGLFNNEKNILFDMITTGAVRGTDGTGLFWIDKEGDKALILKKKQNPYHLLFDKNFENYFKNLEKDARVVVGHHRAATVGDVNDDNAHPFHHKHITLVQNGTLRAGVTTTKEIQVDSHALTIKLAEDDDLQKTIDDINGAYALIWHDAKKKTVNFLRNYERPLHFCEALGSLFFASEEGMLNWLITRNSSHTVKLNTRACPIDTHIEYNLETKKITETPLAKKYYQTTQRKFEENYGYYNTYQLGYQKPNKVTHLKNYKENRERLNEDAIFTLYSKNLQKVGANSFWEYKGKTDEHEQVYFRSTKIFDLGGQEYFGKLKTVHVGKWGGNTPWYEIDPGTIIKVAEAIKVGEDAFDLKEVDEALKDGCFDCKAPIAVNELLECDACDIGTKLVIACPKCSKIHKNLMSKEDTKLC